MATTPRTEGQLVDRIVTAVSHGLCFADADPDSVLPETVNAILAVVLPELDQLRAGRTRRYRAAWLNARNRAAGYQQRYRYERKLCRSADTRATKAIRAQLAAEQKRDELAAELGRVRAELATARRAGLTEAADVLDGIARKQDCFDDEQSQANAEHTRSSARAIRLYAAAAVPSA